MESERKKKLILIKPNGNHSNRLLQNLHFEVFCAEYNIEFHNPTFHDMASYYLAPCDSATNLYFKTLQINLLGKLFRHSRIIKKIFSIVWIISKFGFLKFIRFDNNIESSQSELILLKAFEKHDVVYVGGWRFRSDILAKKYNNEMSERYSLKPNFYKNNSFVNTILDKKSEGATLIGIHIRRGDYRKWKGGIYCYEDDIYQTYMEKISEQLILQNKNNYVFILFSNESLNFKESSNLIISNEKWYIDQHIMSNCHYLFGPPSTFTLWSGYLGQTKLFHIYSANDNVIPFLN